ncbi:MAG: fibronectin type III domain-containing protein, partial [Candidatus Peregrinibacteria bacterium]|nr:fibronectin type III domain-containing protein [Candidatus Peregrinibacteria bacterium]
FNGQNHTVSGLTITRAADYAGLFGYTSYATISATNMTGVSVAVGTGNSYIAGLVGYASNSTITTSSVAGSVSGNFGIGLLVGWSANGTISKSYTSGTATGAYMDVGGLAGMALNTTVSETYSTANATAADNAGGLLGAFSATGHILSNSFARGNAIATGNGPSGHAAGLAGDASYGLVQNCYSTGTATGSQAAGLISWANSNDASNPISNTFWDTTTSGTSTPIVGQSYLLPIAAAKITGKATFQMQRASTYTLLSADLTSAWDFVGNPNNDVGTNDYWNIDGVTNNGYPFLTTFYPPTIQFTATSSSGLESVSPANLGLTLSRIYTSDVTVNYAVTGGTATGGGVDYTLVSGSATIFAGSTTANISPVIINDSIYEPDETIIVTISSPTNGTLGTNTSHTYTILNDDPATPSVQFATTTGNAAESVSPLVATVNLSTVSASDVSINYSITGTATAGSDYTPTSGTLTITAGLSSGTISIPVINDTLKEADETVILTLYSATNATIGASPTFTYTINNDDSAPDIQFAAASSSASEGRGSAVIPVSLSAPSGETITVNYAVTGGTATSAMDYVLNSGTLTFPAGSTTKYIPLTVVDDVLVESDETIIVTLSGATNATLGLQASHTLTIEDNDSYPSVQFSTINSEVAEGSTANIAVALSKAPAAGQDVVVTYTIAGGTAVSGQQYIYASPGTITLNSTTPVNISPVTIADSDTIHQTLIVTLSSPTNATLGTNTVHKLTIKEASGGAPTATGMNVNGASSPATVATSNPVFGWSFQSTLTGDSQRAYRLTLADSEAHLTGGTYICDTGEVASNRSTIDYATACNSTLYAGTFYWRVLVKNVNDSASAFSATQTLTVSSTIATPTACSTSSVTSTSATLVWTDNASNETGVEIEQALGTPSGMTFISNGNYRRIARAAANSISYDATGLNPNTTYFYRIRAVNNTGSSSYIGCVSTLATLAVTPSAPTVTPLSATSLKVNINETGNSGYTSYAIGVGGQYLQTNGTLSGTPEYPMSWSSSQLIISGLTPNTAYPITVTARNTDGTATSASPATTAYTLAGQPSVSTSSPTTTGFSITLDAGSNPSGGTLMAIAIYDGTQTRYVQADGTLGNTIIKQTSVTWGTIAVTGLITNANYRIQAIAYNGDSNEIPTYSFTAGQYTAADAPTSFKVTALTTTSATLFVDTRPGFMYGFNGVAPTVGNTITNGALTNNGTTAAQTALLNNGADTSTVTMGICSAVEMPGPLTQDIAYRTSTSTVIALAVDGNASTTEYQILDTESNQYVSPLGVLTSTPTWATRANLGGASGLTINGLSPAQNFKLRVRARNCQNITTEYGSELVIELPAIAPVAPTVAASSDSNGVSSAQVTINTTGLSLVHQLNFAIYDATTDQYVQNTSGTGSGNGDLGATVKWASYDDWGGAGGYTVNNLSPNITNTFVVKTRKSINSALTDTGFSQKANLVTGVNKALIAANTVTTSTVVLSFNPMGNSPSTEYSIELVPSSGPSTYLTSGGSNNAFGVQSWATLTGASSWDSFDGTSNDLITISGLTPNTSYTLRILGRNTDTTGGYPSPTITAYTASAMPTGVTATAASTSRINLSWGAASNPAGTEYLISSDSQYVVSNALSATATWSTFDNITPTNTTYVDGLSAATQYCFITRSRNANHIESTCNDPTSSWYSLASCVALRAALATQVVVTPPVVTGDITNCYDATNTARFASLECTNARADCINTASPLYSTTACIALRAAMATQVVVTPPVTGDITNCYDATNTARFASLECTNARADCINTASPLYSTTACIALRAAMATQVVTPPTPPTESECNTPSSAAYNTTACVDMRAAALAQQQAGDMSIVDCNNTANISRFASATCTNARATCNNTSSPQYNTTACVTLRAALVVTTTPVNPPETPTNPTDPANPIKPPTPTNPTTPETPSTPGTNSTGSDNTYVTAQDLKKQLDEFKKQKDQGLLTFQIGDLKKEVQVADGVKAETGITREEFIVALVGNVDLEKSYSSTAADKAIFKSKDPIQIADKLEITNAFIEANGTYDKTKFITNGEALQAFYLAANVSENEACAKKIFKTCSVSNPDDRLTKADLTSHLDSLKKYILAQELQKTNSDKIDTDKDGLSNWKETNIYGTDPTKKDTDGDGLSDGEEVNKYLTDPLKFDTDGDGLSDGQEVKGVLNDKKKLVKTNPLKFDTDGDGFSDGQEINGVINQEKVLEKTDPLDPLSFPLDTKTEKGTGDRDIDGLCDLCEVKIGTNPDNADTDGDGLIDSQDPEPLIFNLKDAPVKVLIANLASNTKAASSPFLKGSAPANSTIAIIAKNEFGLKREIARVQASENSQFATELRPLPNGNFFLLAQNVDSGETSPQIKVTIDSTLKPEIPSLESIDGQPLTSKDTNYIPEVTSSPTIKAKLLKGKAVITFKSAIGTSTLISDSSTGELEIRPPEQLPIGDHEVIAYSVQEDENIISPIVKYKFRVTEASNLSGEDFSIKMRSAGGLASFLREKTVTPLFQKIFIGVGIVIIVWLIITVIQFKRRKKGRK